MVWDLPTRLFHWLLFIAVSISLIANQLEEIDWHYYSGLVVLGLVLFRLVWGVIGSHYSRFVQFMSSPAAIWRYLSGLHNHSAGHNPLGAWSVIIMLLTLLIQSLTGLFMTDEVFFEGPWFPVVSEEVAGTIGMVHEINSYFLYALIGLHLLAIAFYQLIKKQALTRAMITGQSGAHKTDKGVRIQPIWLALVVAVVVTAIVLAVVLLAPKPASVDF